MKLFATQTKRHLHLCRGGQGGAKLTVGYNPTRNDDIEPLSKNETLFTYSLLSGSYGEKEKGQTLNFEDLSNLAPQVGLEPTTP